jgi:hypothetical protein
MTDGGLRLTIREMKKSEWEMLCESLPREGNELEVALRHLSWGQGWLRKDGSPTDTGTRYLREVWIGLAGGPYQAGEFRAERVGLEIQFAIDAIYAAERAQRRRRRQDQTPWEQGWQTGNHGSRSDLLPYRAGTVDAVQWYQGYCTGLARRTNTARASRAGRGDVVNV